MYNYTGTCIINRVPSCRHPSPMLSVALVPVQPPVGQHKQQPDLTDKVPECCLVEGVPGQVDDGVKDAIQVNQ